MAKAVSLKSRKPCPICKKGASESFYPFCSQICADEDLNRWLGGKYAIPVTEADDDDGNDVMQ